MKEDRGGEEGSIVREVLEVRNTLSATRDACGGQHQKCLSVRPSTSLFVCLSVFSFMSLEVFTMPRMLLRKHSYAVSHITAPQLSSPNLMHLCCMRYIYQVGVQQSTALTGPWTLECI